MHADNDRKIIGTVRRYVGRAHRWAIDHPVRIVAVIRGPESTGRVLRDDEEIGELRPDDVVEFVPLIEDPGQPARRSWVTSDATPAELAEWRGPSPA